MSVSIRAIKYEDIDFPETRAAANWLANHFSHFSTGDMSSKICLCMDNLEDSIAEAADCTGCEFFHGFDGITMEDHRKLDKTMPDILRKMLKDRDGWLDLDIDWG